MSPSSPAATGGRKHAEIVLAAFWPLPGLFVSTVCGHCSWRSWPWISHTNANGARARGVCCCARGTFASPYVRSLPCVTPKRISSNRGKVKNILRNILRNPENSHICMLATLFRSCTTVCTHAYNSQECPNPEKFSEILKNSLNFSEIFSDILKV